MAVKKKKYDEDDLERLSKMTGEQFSHNLEAFLENFETVLNIRVRATVKEELRPIKSDIKIVKSAVTDTNKQARNHEVRITKLEKQAA